MTSKSARSNAGSDSSSTSSHSSDSDCTGNDGESSDWDEEAPATAALRGKVALVSAKCPRRYLRKLKIRKARGQRIPSDMGKEEFLQGFRGVVGTQCNETLKVASCHAEPHARVRASTKQPEGHYHLAVRMSNNFPHQRVAQEFKRKYGITITFNFKWGNLGEVLGHLMQPGRKPSEGLDTKPATYPARLDLKAELPTAPMAGDSSDLEEQWIVNEGESSDDEEEAPAHQSLRGFSSLVTASCPRQYPQDLEVRRAKGLMIPEDFTKDEFLLLLRRVLAKYCTQKVVKASCHSEPHKRFRPSCKKRERHYHVALLMSGNFAHLKIANAFQKEHGIRISFSFKLKRFVGNLQYLMVAAKKPSTDLDLEPATYPPKLDVKKELKEAKLDGDIAVEGRKRKRLTFDEASNVVIEGIGDGPLRTVKALEQAAKTLKYKGSVELWNYLGTLKTSSETSQLLTKIWRLQGDVAHPFFHVEAPRALEEFEIGCLRHVKEWLDGKYKTHVLVLSGDGGLGKTSLAEALLARVSSGGYWFVDDPDDLRELEGQLVEGQGILVDEIKLATYPVDQIKKLFDLEKARRIKCRHFNATIPRMCARIFTTNSTFDSFYPKIDNPFDYTGVMRRQLFQSLLGDVRIHGSAQSEQQPALSPTLPLLETPNSDWRQRLQQVCLEAAVEQHTPRLISAAEQLGVALWAEVPEVIEEMIKNVGLQHLERRRLIVKLQASLAN